MNVYVTIMTEMTTTVSMKSSIRLFVVSQHGSLLWGGENMKTVFATSMAETRFDRNSITA